MSAPDEKARELKAAIMASDDERKIVTRESCMHGAPQN